MQIETPFDRELSAPEFVHGHGVHVFAISLDILGCIDDIIGRSFRENSIEWFFRGVCKPFWSVFPEGSPYVFVAFESLNLSNGINEIDGTCVGIALYRGGDDWRDIIQKIGEGPVWGVLFLHDIDADQKTRIRRTRLSAMRTQITERHQRDKRHIFVRPPTNSIRYEISSPEVWAIRRIGFVNFITITLR